MPISDIERLLTILVTFGTAIGIQQWGKGVIGWITGRNDREKIRVRALLNERDYLMEKFHRELEYSTSLRVILIEQGVKPEDLPKRPALVREDGTEEES